MPSVLCRNPELIEAVLQRMENGEVLTAIGREVGFTPAAFAHYAYRDEKFAERYARARVLQAASMADDVIRIVDDPDEDPQRARVRSDARKWLAARIDPKSWADRQEHVHSGQVEHVLTVDAAALTDIFARSLERRASKLIEHEPAASPANAAPHTDKIAMDFP